MLNLGRLKKNKTFYALKIIIILVFMIFINNNIYARWETEEILVKEEVEKLSFFDRLDGKKAKVERTYKKLYKWYPDDSNNFVVDDYAFIPVDIEKEAEKEGYAYKCYFDKKGYLITDNITKDLNIVNKDGYVIDNELKPIYYFIGEEKDSKEEVYISKNEKKEFIGTMSQIIIAPGTRLIKSNEKIYNNLIDKKMENHISAGNKYQKDVKGTIWTKAKWNNAIRLSGTGASITFNNILNNFNKVSGKIATEYSLSSDRTTKCTLYIYDKEKYDKGLLDEYIAYFDSFNYSNFQDITFTFDRRIKNIVFYLIVDGEYKNKICFLKDLRFGFSKEEYKHFLEILEQEKEEAEDLYLFNNYLDELEEMGIYTKNTGLLNIIDEDGELLYEIKEQLEETEDYYYKKDYDEELYNRYSGPAFDEKLINEANKKIGPYYDIVGTVSETKKKNNQSKIYYPD